MKILDLTAGNRAIWYDKNNPLVTFLDRRAEVNPTIVCDTTNIPPEVGTEYDLIVYDPPHCATGPNSNMSKVYGWQDTQDIMQSIKGTGHEAWRVSKRGALMVLKWNTRDIRLQRVLDYLPQWEPLFGHLTKSGPRSQTYWVLLRRLD